MPRIVEDQQVIGPIVFHDVVVYRTIQVSLRFPQILNGVDFADVMVVDFEDLLKSFDLRKG